jgi:hypothetical protein
MRRGKCGKLSGGDAPADRRDHGAGAFNVETRETTVSKGARARAERQRKAARSRKERAAQHKDALGLPGRLDLEAMARDLGVPEAERLVEELLLALELEEDNPHNAALLQEMTVTTMVELAMGIAWPERFKDVNPEGALDVAFNMRMWAILYGGGFLFDWPEPAALLTPEQIVARIREWREVLGEPGILSG